MIEEPGLGLCPRLHPLGAAYRLQHLTDVNDGVDEAARKRERMRFCPWCDWKRLRGNKGHARGPKVIRRGLECLA